MVPKFKHDCTGCKFIGNGSYHNKIVDWYVCDGVIGRTIIARYSDVGPDYSSTPIGGCVDITNLEMAALAQGLDLTPNEKDTLLKKLLTKRRQALSIKELDELLSDAPRIGTSDWLSTKSMYE